MSDDRPIFNVNSFGQQGGITAGQVNIGLPPRRLAETQKQDLRGKLPRSKRIRVMAVMGDEEAFIFAQQIRDFLAQDGYDVSGIDRAMFDRPVVGHGIRPRDDGTLEVIVGARQ